jgi:ProP effector
MNMRQSKTPTQNALDARARALLRQLVENYPQAFGATVPLAFGIKDAIIAATGCDAGTCDRCLHKWTKRQNYVVALRNGIGRVNLDGTAAGPVDLVHRLHAGKDLVAMTKRQTQK